MTMATGHESKRRLNGLVFALAAFSATSLITRAEVPSRETIPARAAVANRSRYAGRNDIFLRPGLVADKKARTVTISARATGLGSNDVAEFLLMAPGSGHGYEALASSLASAGDVHAALEFIGMTPGSPYDPAALRFWPKGERVIMNVAYRDANSAPRTVRAERLIRNKRTGEPMRETGFVFAGSRMVATPDGKAYAADVREPRSIVANYNESDTVLDVPRQAVQGEVYEQQMVNADFVFTNAQPLQVILSPEYNGKTRVADVSLAISRTEEAGDDLAGLSFTLERDGQTWKTSAGMNDMLAAFTELVNQGRDPYVTVTIGPAVRIGAAKAICNVLNSVETEAGIRVEPPPAGHLYYRAYLPSETFRTRSERLAQPCELLLDRDEVKGVTARLVTIEQEWKDDSLKPVLTVQTNAVPSSAALSRVLKTKTDLPVLLVFADPGLTRKELLDYLTPAMTTHPTVHVYTGEPR